MGYRKVRQLGRGGVATVWLAVADDGREVALKQLDILREDLRDRLIQEGRVQRQVRHPNVVEVLDAIELDGRPTLVLELVGGGTLSTWAPGRDPAAIERVLRGILAGLGAAHEAGLVHRDLKPSNILMDGEVPKIADFGIARALDGDSGATRTGMALGTPWYMPPEQIRDPRHVDRRADLWAVGAILYEMLTGRTPLVGEDVVSLHDQAVRRAWTPLRELRPDVPVNLAAVVDAALRPSRDDRVADVSAILGILDHPDTAPVGSDTRAGVWTLGKQLPTHAPVQAWEVRAGTRTGVAKAIPIGADRAALARFEREEQLLRELSHPRVPRILDGFVEGGRRWFVREAVPGPPLSAEIAGRRPPLPEILDKLDAILRTVADLHALVPPVVHRDLTPDAIVVRPEGAWIVEFGTARGDTDGRLADGTFVGTFGFMAPEQFGGEAGVTSDVRAIGAIAAWMLTRRHPRALEKNGELVWRPHTQVSPALAAWVDNLLDPDPSRRPTAAAARGELEALREDHAPPIRPVPTPRPPRPLPVAPPVVLADPGETIDLDPTLPPALRAKEQWVRGRVRVPGRGVAMIGLGAATLALVGGTVLTVLVAGAGAVAMVSRADASPPPTFSLQTIPGGGWPETPGQLTYGTDGSLRGRLSADPAPGQKVGEPWASLALPLAGARVVSETPARLVVDVPGRAGDVMQQFTFALFTAGWGPVLDLSQIRPEHARFKDHLRQLRVLAEDQDGGVARVELSMTIEPEGTESRGLDDLDAPWDTVGLPDTYDALTFSASDRVFIETPTTLEIEAPDGMQAAFARYDAALRRAGWRVDRRPSVSADIGVARYHRDAALLEVRWRQSQLKPEGTRIMALLPGSPLWNSPLMPDPEKVEVDRKIVEQAGVAPAGGLDCAGIANLAALHIPDDVIVQTIAGSATTFSATDVACLERKGVPPDVVAAVRNLVDGTGSFQDGASRHVGSATELRDGETHRMQKGGIGLGDPWDDLLLPDERLDVVAKNDAWLALRARGAPDAVARRFVYRLEKDGWRAVGGRPADGQRFRRDGEDVVLTVSPSSDVEGASLVTLSVVAD